MRIFELHFNYKKKGTSVFDSFVYEPSDVQEKQMGSLCAAGELTGNIPRGSSFLNNLADAIKIQFYYRKDFSEALKEANNFLDKEVKSGNVNWLGNLNFAIINIKDSILNFTKVGNIKVLLLKDGEILDIGQNLELQDQEPYPLKVFSNIASGKLSAQDKILITTQDFFSAIAEKNSFLSQLTQASKEKELENIFKINKKNLSDVSGICMLITEGTAPLSMALPYINFTPPKLSGRIISVLFLTLIITAAPFIFKGEQKEETIQPRQDIQKILQDVRYKILMADNFIILKKEKEALSLIQEAQEILLPIIESDLPLSAEVSSLKRSIDERLKQ